jgi:hypothetical protein
VKIKRDRLYLPLSLFPLGEPSPPPLPFPLLPLPGDGEEGGEGDGGSGDDGAPVVPERAGADARDLSSDAESWHPPPTRNFPDNR